MTSLALHMDTRVPHLVAQQYSDGVAGFVSSSYANGAITYVEYGYAKQRGFPGANLQHRSGYFVQPVPAAVPLALNSATFNPDGTQSLLGVCNAVDRRAFPMSSYSYMIVPTSTVAPFNPDKGATLGRLILYFLSDLGRVVTYGGRSNAVPRALFAIGTIVVGGALAWSAPAWRAWNRTGRAAGAADGGTPVGPIAANVRGAAET